MELTVFNIKGEDTGRKIALDSSIFGIEPNEHAVYLDVKQHLANRRQGTHKTLERSDMEASTRKLRRQKGTGSARVGSIKSPLFKGGARIFGPRPRDYSFKLNKKIKNLARLSALSYKAKDDAIKIIEDFSIEIPKTKEYAEILNNLHVQGKSLLVLSAANRNIVLASRNLLSAKVVSVSDMNTYDILNSSVILFLESSIQKLQEQEKTLK